MQAPAFGGGTMCGMERETNISRRDFTRVGAGVLGAALFAGKTAVAVPLRSVGDVVADDLAAGRTPVAGYAPRLEGLRGRVIGFVGNGAYEEERTFAVIRAYLEDEWSCTVIDQTHFARGQGIIAKENNGVAETMAGYGVEAAVLGNAGCSHCSIAVGRAAAQLELAGIPTAIVARRAFERHLCFSFAAFGLPSQPTVSWYVPGELFAESSDLTPLVRHADDVLRALTSERFAFRPANMDITI